MRNWTERSATRRAIDQLDRAVHYLNQCAGTPRLRGPAERRWYQFEEQGPLQVIVVKTARVVSALNAIPMLLELGYSTEAACLLRTVDDFLDECTFVMEGAQHASPPSAYSAFLQHFFAESVEAPEALLAQGAQPDRVRKKSIRAAQGRFLNAEDPSTIQRFVRAIDGGWDGYVHGGYPHSMELCQGDTWHLNGLVGSPYVVSLWFHYGHYISRAFSVLAFAVLMTGNEAYKNELIGNRDAFEVSDDFE